MPCHYGCRQAANAMVIRRCLGHDRMFLPGDSLNGNNSAGIVARRHQETDCEMAVIIRDRRIGGIALSIYASV